MPSHTRREFLATTSFAAAGVAAAVFPRFVQALPVATLRSAAPAAAFLPEPLAVSDLRTLVSRALEVAAASGATYADVRVAEREQIEITVWSTISMDPALTTRMRFDYGIRVLVDGAEA